MFQSNPADIPGYMEPPNNLPALIPAARRNEWKERLLNVCKNTSCADHLCMQWDSGYNTADDELLNSRRECDQTNYFVWMNGFCEYLDPEAEQSLLLLQRKGGCVPCIGRLIYQYLRMEYMKSFMVQQEDFEFLRDSPDFPNNLRKPRGRKERGLRDAVMDWLTLELVQTIESQCGHRYYEHLALLLNCGSCFPSHLLGGVFGDTRFHCIEIDNYTEAMLRARADRADPLGTFVSLTNDLSPERLQRLLSYMRSRKQ